MVYIGSWFIKYIYTVNNMMMYKEYISLTAGHVLLLGALAVDLQTPTIYKTQKEEGESIHGLPETLADADTDWMMESRSRAATGCWSLEHGDQRKKGTRIWRSDEEEGGLDLESLARAREELRWRGRRITAAGGVPVAPKTPMPTLHRAPIYASPDPLFAKLPKLQTPIAKRLETTICAFCQKIRLPNSNAQPLDML
jgi:hypothetical protein